MGIEFEALTGVSTGRLSMQLEPLGFRLFEVDPGVNYLALELPSPSIDTPYWIGDLRFQMPALGMTLSNALGGHMYFELPELRAAFSGIETAVNVAILQFSMPSPWMQSVGLRNSRGALDMQLPTVSTFFANALGGHMYLKMPAIGMYTRDTLGPENFGILVQSAGFMFGYGAVSVDTLSDTLTFGDSLVMQWITTLIDVLNFSDTLPTSLRASNTLSDNLILRDVLTISWSVLMNDGLVFGDSLAAKRHAIEECIDVLVLSGAVSTQLAALNAIADWLALGDTLVRFDVELLNDALVFGDSLGESLAGIAQMLDTLLLGDSLAAPATFVMAVEDTFVLGDSISSSAAFINLLEDGVVFQTRLRIDGQLYVGYVCNTALQAYTEYRDVPYNSFAKVGHTYFAAGDRGVYRLGGTDRDGTAIRATLRSGLTNFGTGKLKRMPSLYLGYATDGRIVVKKILTSETGAKSEYWYQLVAKTADVTREGRLEPGRGKGLKSVYWQWELEVIDASQFSLDYTALLPIILDRRV